ncbi:MAG: hypothetical protein LBC90_06020 [Candidatus Adiutrix sp.]|nr:hypothetical protein [Candidatus Adiutrix sp.]
MALVAVEFHPLAEILGQTVEIGKKIGRDIVFFHAPQQFVNQGLGVDFFLNINWQERDFQIPPVLFILALPNQLRVQGRVAGIAEMPGCFGRQKIPQFLGRDILASVLMTERSDSRSGYFFFGFGHNRLNGAAMVSILSKIPG